MCFQNAFLLQRAHTCMKAAPLVIAASHTDVLLVQILVSGSSDYAVTGGTSRCIQMVNRAKALTQKSVMFVPTLFWVNENQADLSSVNQQVCLRLPHSTTPQVHLVRLIHSRSMASLQPAAELPVCCAHIRHLPQCVAKSVHFSMALASGVSC